MKKGYVLLYTLILGLLCIIMAVCCFTLELQIRKNNLSYRNYCLKPNINEEYKENLLTLLNKSIKNSVADITSNNIKDYYILNCNSFKITYKKSYIIYDKNNDDFIMYSYYDEYYHREDIYKYKINEGKLIYMYVNTKYNLGKVVA